MTCRKIERRTANGESDQGSEPTCGGAACAGLAAQSARDVHGPLLPLVADSKRRAAAWFAAIRAERGGVSLSKSPNAGTAARCRMAASALHHTSLSNGNLPRSRLPLQ